MDPQPEPSFSVRLAQTSQDLTAAQRLRYEVFVQELGGGGALVDHGARLEKDRFDPFFDHLLLWDNAQNRVAGVYRLMRSDQARAAGQFYSADEYDLSVLQGSGRRLLELGRSCVHQDYRGGMAMYHLWSGLSRYIATHNIEILFGVASFHGTDIAAISEALSLLHHRHLAPSDLRVRAQPSAFQRMDLVAKEALDARAAMLRVPA
ncbi:GNAT family N-acetyltransferase, partial [Roseobacter sp.]|uniref:GNAT family N-acetyltransferase n=1 Tax=Roseobacter sp. TaxID=1907202 RepID=UPI003296825C